MMHNINSPDNSDSSIEREIQSKGLTAARVTPAQVDDTIRTWRYHVFPDSQLTVCVIKLRNGFTVSGESACASPENFDVEIGQRIAFQNAREKIWALEGYLLKERLYIQSLDLEFTRQAPVGWSTYRGTKVLFAQPMTRGEYNIYRGWQIPEGEEPGEPGYMVEYTDGGAPNHPKHKGYISWSPADVFEKAYHKIS